MVTNLNRRKRSCIDRARIFRELKRSMLQRGIISQAGAEIRDVVAAKLNFGLSGRQLERDEKLLDLPQAIQVAVEAETITKSLALQVLQLPEAVQQQIATGLGSGALTAIMVQHTFLKSRTTSPQAALHRLLKVLRQVIPVIEANPDEVAERAQARRGAIETIATGIETLNCVQERCEQLNARITAGLSEWSNVGVRASPKVTTSGLNADALSGS